MSFIEVNDEKKNINIIKGVSIDQNTTDYYIHCKCKVFESIMQYADLQQKNISNIKAMIYVKHQERVGNNKIHPITRSLV